MKSKFVLVLWCINLCSKLAASIPFYEDSAQHIVGAQQASGLLYNVLENNNAHSQLKKPVALSHSFNPDAIYPSGIRSIEQEQATKSEQRGDTRWHALSRESGFPSVPQDVEARYQALPMPYREKNFRSEAPINQMSTGRPQIQLLQDSLRQPFIRQPVDTQPNQRPFVRQAVEKQSNQLHFIRQLEKEQLQFIRRPEESIQQYPAQRHEGPSNVGMSWQSSGPNNQYIPPLPPKPFVPFRPENVAMPFGKPEETITNRQLFTTHVNNQQLLQTQQSTGLPPGMNHLQQIAASNELQKLAASKTKSRYIVVYPNGTVEYVDQLETVAKKYPDYVMLNGYKPGTASNTPLGTLSPQMQNLIAQRPSNPAQYDANLGTQVPVNDETQRRTQNNVVRTQTQNYQNDENVNYVLETKTPAVTTSTEIVEEIPIEITKTGTEGSQTFVTKEILNTPYPTSKSSETQSTELTYASEANHNQTAQPESQSNHDKNQSEGTIQAHSQSSYEPKKEDKIVHTKIKSFTSSETQSQEQSESNVSGDKEQQQTQTRQVQTQSSLESTQQTQNEYTTSSQAPTENSASSSSETYSTSDLATSIPSQTEYALMHIQSQKNYSESSSNAFDLASSKPSPIELRTNDTKEDQDVTQTIGEGQGMTTTANDDCTASSESESKSQSQPNSKQLNILNNATSEADSQSRPYTWFSTQDPDFFEKLMGKDKVLGVVYFFMVPSNAPEHPE